MITPNGTPSKERLSPCLSSLSNLASSMSVQTTLSTSSQCTTPNTSITINNDYKNQKRSKNKNKNAYNISPISVKTVDSFNSPPTSPSLFPPRIDTRRWSNLGGNVLQRIRDPSLIPSWQPNHLLPALPPTDPFGQLLVNQDLSTILKYCQGTSDTVLRLYRKPDIHITTKDIRDIISHNTPIYHESLILCLELICATYNGSYVDPSFIPTLKTQGWAAVARRFHSPTRASAPTLDHPSLNHSSIAIPVHVNGFHWAALCRRIIHGVVYFFYADDMNSSSVEHSLKRLILRSTNSDFAPSNSIWVNCKTPNFRPHSNECGPRTMLALAVMLTHPAPHKGMLLPYISSNLAQNSRHWMCITLLSGMLILLPPALPDSSVSPTLLVDSHPHTLISWEPAVTNLTRSATTTGTTSSPPFDNNCPHHGMTIASSVPKQTTLPKIIGAQQSLPGTKLPKPPVRVKGKCLQPPTQLTLFDTKQFSLAQNISGPDVWGHLPDPIDSNSTFRLFFNNPNGLKLSSDPLSVQYSLSLLSSLGVGAISLAETNLNWNHPRIVSRLKSTIKKEWKHSALVTSHIIEDITSEIQPGGTLTVVTNNWTSRIIDRGADPYGLGRWTYVTMRGKDGIKITLVTAYRICPQTLSSIGPHTSTAQQFRHLSKDFREADLIHDPKPRLQFIVDLQAWLEYKIQDNHSIILALDANEGIQDITGSYHPLEFTLDRPISTKGHDGSLATLMHTCGLRDPLCLQHTESPPPPTYSRGKDRIDYILISTGLLPSVIRTGIFPYDQIFIADHRPCYIDFDSAILFRDETPSIAPHQYRGLQTIDPRLTQEYVQTVTQQIQYHKIESRLEALHHALPLWNDSHITEYESIDRLLTEAMQAAEKKISKKVTLTYAWSPTLKQAVASLKYWQLSLKKANGRSISDSILLRYQYEANLDLKLLPNPLRIPDIVTRLRQARKDLYELQKRHLELRANHLLALADARLLARKPTLLEPANAHQLDKQC